MAARKQKPGDSEQDLAKPRAPRAPRQVWLVLHDDRKNGYEAYVTLKSAKAEAPPNAVIVGPYALTERDRQR